jgi:hypothetical protein
LQYCIGYFKGLKQHRNGYCLWASGSKYEGTFENDSRNGFGVFTYSQESSDDLDKYKGSWRRAAKHGNGTLFWRNGMKYEGEFNKNKRQGFGKLTFAEDDEFDRVVYIGNFKNDKKHGNGSLSWKSKARFEGNFENDQIQGQGRYFFPPGGDIERYEGKFKKGVFDNKDGTIWLKGGKEFNFKLIS